MENSESSNMIEISDHSYSTPYIDKQPDTSIVSNISGNNKSECRNRDSAYVKNSQGENTINIFDEIQNIGKLFHYC